MEKMNNSASCINEPVKDEYAQYAPIYKRINQVSSEIKDAIEKQDHQEYDALMKEASKLCKALN
jgi:mevalonate kinase